jgi:tRNA pseudouridine55 synthase
MSTQPPPFRTPATPRPVDPYDGVLLVDKAAGPTSHDVVDAVRRHFGFDKVGHGGTLDPQATGLLVLLIGRATKLSDRFLASDKAYDGDLLLGVATDSYDADGRIVREADWHGVTREQVEAEMTKRQGDILQTPPMVSAVKIEGVPLYKHARKGQTVERKPRLIHVYEFRLRAFNPPIVSFTMRCTKGTYVRSLCAEVGDAVGCGAHLKALRRTASGTFKVESAIPLDAILAMDRTQLRGRILSLHDLALASVI